MFYYYGAKNRLCKHYPAPMYSTIIEPFAGSAAYSQVYGRDRRVILIDKDQRIIDLWSRLMVMPDQDILNYPVPEVGDYTEDLLIMLSAASNAVLKMRRLKITQRVVDEFPRMLARIVKLKPICSHFELICGDYNSFSNIEATWFIDPPYQAIPSGSRAGNPKGMGYRYGADLINYKSLATFCRTRRGQTIVCEQEGASWLPFQPLIKQRSSFGRINTEVVWTRPYISFKDLSDLSVM